MNSTHSRALRDGQTDQPADVDQADPHTTAGVPGQGTRNDTPDDPMPASPDGAPSGAGPGGRTRSER